MAITRSQIARQLLAEGGAPRIPFQRGGTGFEGSPEMGGRGTTESYGFDQSSGGDNDPIQDQIQSRPVQKTPVRDIVAGGLDTIARFTIPGYGRVRSAMDISNFISRNTQPKVTNIVDEVALTGGRTVPTMPEGDSDTQIAQPVMPIMPLVPKLPTDIEPPKSDMEFVQRFNLPERFRLADGGDVSVKDAEKMAPPGESLAYINDDEAALLKSLGGAGKAVNETGIPSFFVKKLFKKATKAVKKVVKSPIGKAALLGAVGFGIPGTSVGGLFGRASFGGAAKGLFGTQGISPFLFGTKGVGMDGGTAGFLKNLGLSKEGFGDFGGLTKKGLLTAGIGASTIGGLAAAGEEEEDIDSLAGRIADETGIDVAQIRKEVQDAYASGDISGLQSKYPFLIPTSAAMADGGIARLGYADGETVLDISNVNLDSKMKAAEKLSKETGMPIEKALEKIMADAFAEGVSIKKIKEEMVMPKRKPPKEVQKRKEKNFKKAKPALEKESADMIEDLIRSKKAGGGLMDLGGNEMDLRGGGFVPIGAKEKADDVPARLSKNEFVFTADAVRAAGGGSVEKGAQKMYNTMKLREESIA